MYRHVQLTSMMSGIASSARINLGNPNWVTISILPNFSLYSGTIWLMAIWPPWSESRSLSSCVKICMGFNWTSRLGPLSSEIWSCERGTENYIQCIVNNAQIKAGYTTVAILLMQQRNVLVSWGCELKTKHCSTVTLLHVQWRAPLVSFATLNVHLTNQDIKTSDYNVQCLSQWEWKRMSPRGWSAWSDRSSPSCSHTSSHILP